MKLVIDTAGSVRAVYSDKLKNMNLGPMQVRRASNVEFDENKQIWEARNREGELIATHANRDVVIRKEVSVLESQL